MDRDALQRIVADDLLASRVFDVEADPTAQDDQDPKWDCRHRCSVDH